MAKTFKKTISVNHRPRTHREWKSMSNRRHRRYYKNRTFLYDEDTVFPKLREVSNVWDSPRDGIGGYPEMDLRMLKNGSGHWPWWAEKWWRYAKK